jgi:hypothetical protein
MVAWPVNWNVVRPDLVVGSGPRALSDLDAICGATRASALRSVQHDECLDQPGIDDAAHVRHGRRLGLTMERRPPRDFDPADPRRGRPAAVRGLHGLPRQGHRVYGHCTAGRNRAPRGVLADPPRVEGIGLEAAMTLLVRARPEVCPTWAADHGCWRELTARQADRIRRRAAERGQGAAPPAGSALWLQAEREIGREVLTTG